MSDASDYLITVDNDKAEALRIAQATAAKLESKQVTLIQIVESLGVYFRDEDVAIRSKALSYLSQVIESLQPTVLTRQQINVLCEFLCDRIEDGGALRGLSSLQKLERFNKDMAITVFRAILGHFHDLRLRTQSQRFAILTLLNSLMGRHRQAIESLGDESLVGIIDLVSGEKDPRNLMVVFSLLRVLMVEWDINNHAALLFDSVFCYFPITFRPPPDDPYGITAHDLKLRLRECISASTQFAPYAFPQLIDKLDSTSPNVKRDVLETMNSCVQTYGVISLYNYLVSLWECLKYEILNVQEDDHAEGALKILETLTDRLSRDTDLADSGSPLQRYLGVVIRDCNKWLQEPQHKQAKSASQILAALARQSASSLHLVVKGALPALLTLYQAAHSIDEQRAVLEPILELLQAGLAIHRKHAIALATAIENPFAPFADSLYETFSQALMSTSKAETLFRVVALKCLLGLCLNKSVLQANEIGLVVQYLDEIVLEENNSDARELRSTAIEGLSQISNIIPALIMEITFPLFLSRLPEVDDPKNGDYLLTLESLALVSKNKETAQTLLRRLFSRLDRVLEDGQLGEYCCALLSTLHYIFSQQDLGEGADLGTHYMKMIGLIRMVVSIIERNGSSTPANRATLVALGRLGYLIFKHVDSQKQDEVAKEVYTLFSGASTTTSNVIAANGIIPKLSTIILSTYILAAIRREVRLPLGGESFDLLLVTLSRESLAHSSDSMRHDIRQHLALLINKFLPAQSLNSATALLWAQGSGLLDPQNISKESIKTALWVSKALILRLSHASSTLDGLLSLLAHPTLGIDVAHGFGLIFAQDEVLSKENGATIRLLAKQKAFNVCMPKMIASSRDVDPTVKANYMTALAGLLGQIDVAIYIPVIRDILPLLLQSLDHKQQVVRCAAIQTLATVSSECSYALEEHVPSLVGRLVRIAVDTVTNLPHVRYHALRCLRGLPGQLKESSLLPYRHAVIRGLVDVLDDPKRQVRKEAVDCRSTWSNMDEAEDE